RPAITATAPRSRQPTAATLPPPPPAGAGGLTGERPRHADFSSLKAGDTVVLIGETRGELGASMYLREVLGREDGAPPPVDLAVERRNGELVRGLIQDGTVRTVHDLADGGLAAAAAEMALASNVGLALTLGAEAPH